MTIRQTWRRIPRLVRIGLWSLAGLIGVVVIVVGVALATFDPNALKPRIIDAVKQATGRTLTLNGRIGLGYSLQPTLVVQDVAFANPPGFSGPNMATLERLDLRLALLPLLSHRIEIHQLILVRPDIQLETDKQGRANWQFAPAEPSASPANPVPAGAPQAKPATHISIAAVRIEHGRVSYHDDSKASTTVLGLTSLKADADTPDSNLKLSTEAEYNGTAFALSGEIGPLTRLQDAEADTPWPVRLTLTSGGAKLAVDGTLTKPIEGRGYRLKVAGDVPDLAALSAFLPGQKLPPLHDVSVSAQVSDTGGMLPEISSLTLHLGKSDLGWVVAGLQLGKLDIDAARFDQPVKAAAQGSLSNVPLSLAAALGAPAGLLPGAKPAGPFPVDVNLQAGGNSLAVKGAIADPQHLAGVDLAVTAAIADLAALSPLVHQPLPGLKSIAFQGQLHDAGGGLAKGVALSGVKLTLPQADVAGDAAVELTGLPSLRANLKSDKIDADALLAALATPVPAAKAAGAGPAAPPHARDDHLIPNTPIPFGLLRLADADVTFSGNEMRYDGALYHAIALHAVLHGGKLQVDPFSADMPEGHLSGTLSADATQMPPAVAVRLQAPGLAAGPLLAAMGYPGYANGKLEVYANLHGAGDTPHAIAAGVDGSVGVAMANGTVDNRLLGSTLGSILRQINLLDLAGRGGSSQLQCFAARVDLNRGIGTFRTLALSSSLLTMDGDGSINLGGETVDMRVRPQAKVIATDVVVPMRVTGSMRSPTAVPDPTATITANAGTVAGAVVGGATPLGLAAGLLGGDKVIKNVLGGGGGVDCAAALAIARSQSGAAPVQPAAQTGAPGQAAPAPAPAPAQAAKPKPASPGDLLKQLFR